MDLTFVPDAATEKANMQRYPVKISNGFTPIERPIIAAMYWNAFGKKLGRVMGPDHRATDFVAAILDPSHAICARDAQGDLLGVAGFKTYNGALVSGDWRDLARHYGWIGSTWRAGLLALLERDTENRRFLMDGIFVRDTARGQGVGTALLDAICDEAKSRGFAQVRLDVIDTNARAKALYLRQGFEVGETQPIGLLKHVFGFKNATVMVRQV